MRKLVISDIHGCYDEFNELLKLVSYNPQEDKLILLGDYCDRGLKSKEVIEQVKNLRDKWNIIALRGNHDQMFVDAIEKDEDFNWLCNGGLQTVKNYVGSNWFENEFNYEEYIKAKEFIKEQYPHHISFIKSLPLYHEDEEFIYVHAGINSFYKDWKNQPEHDFLWIRDLFINNETNVDKIVVFGHTPTIHIHESEDIWFGGDKIGIDGGCVFGLQLNCLEINEDDFKTHFVNKMLVL